MACISLRAVSLAALAGILIPIAPSAFAQPTQVVRFLQNETDPPSIAFYNKAIAEFEKQNPDIKIEMESVSTDARLQKVTAALRAHTMPDVFKLLSEERVEFARKGYLVPLDGMISEIGEKDFVAGTLSRIDGHYYDVPYALNNFSVLWYRSDLLKAAGLQPPKNWDDLRAAAKTLNKDGVNGFIFPAGQNRMTSLYLAMMMWSAGGTFFDKNLNVTFDNPGTIKALTFMKDMAQYSPKGLASYSYSDMINVYLTGKVGLDIYAARLIANAQQSVPNLAQQTSAALMPAGPAGVGVQFLSTNSYAIASPKAGAKHTEAAMKFLKFIVSGDRARDFALTAFPHMIPPIKSEQEAVLAAGKGTLNDRDDLGRTTFDVSNALDFDQEAGATFSDGKVVKSGVPNPYIGPIIARGIPAQVVQHVVLGGEDPAKAAAWGAAQMNAIVRDLKDR
jgi:ABC-type glycerol-3-phosphate transport system substrate-binding protein